jgi:predicted nuclease of restriction endonuclease-like (RecB) superfamily
MKKAAKTRPHNLPSRQLQAVTAASPGQLLTDVRALIEAARRQVASAVNSTLVLLYWRVGKRIREEILCEQRAAYGEQIVSTLSRRLTAQYGNGYSKANLSRMMRLAEVFPHEEIVSALSKQLGWSHFVEIIPLDDPLKRDFYGEMCRVERWSVRTLRKKIDGMLYERTAISRRPEEVVRRDLTALRDEDRLSPDLVFRDPYFLDFLGLTDAYNERDLERAILRELEAEEQVKRLPASKALAKKTTPSNRSSRRNR